MNSEKTKISEDYYSIDLVEIPVYIYVLLGSKALMCTLRLLSYSSRRCVHI